MTTGQNLWRRASLDRAIERVGDRVDRGELLVLGLGRLPRIELAKPVEQLDRRADRIDLIEELREVIEPGP